MYKYPKIQTMFKRNPEKNYKTVLLGEWARPEFSYLADLSWEWSEKIDGTNVRIIWDYEDGYITFKGKTDNAQVPTFLFEKLSKMFSEQRFQELYPETSMCIYGEGYGMRISKGGGNYIPDGVSFISFDININGVWLERKDVDEITDKLNIDVVPVVGYGTLIEAALYAQEGFKSGIGSAQAEGLVIRPPIGLLDRNGRRVITKIKHKDFSF